jgi:penicillin-binding protein 1A
MVNLGFIPKTKYSESKDSPISARIHATQAEVEAPYVAEMIRSEMVDGYGDDAYTTGFSVYTTIDSRLQSAANRALRKAIQEYDRRHGYRGSEQNLDLSANPDPSSRDKFLGDLKSVGDLPPALVTGVEEKSVVAYLGGGEEVTIPWEGLEWAAPYKDENHRGRKPKTAGEIVKAGDLVRVIRETKDDKFYWRLSQIPGVEGALVSLDPNSGATLALVGGYDFYHSKFNRVTQAKRQPGSGFKAFIYSAALEAGFTAASLINDAPVVFDDPSLEAAWRPENYSGKFFGPTRLRYALTKSRNLVSIRLLRAMGIQHARKHAEQFGFDPQSLPKNLSLALGSCAVTPLEMATGYAVLANGGFRIEPYFIERIEDRNGEAVRQATPLHICEACDDAAPAESPETTTIRYIATEERAAPRVISRQNHYLMNSMMRDVIQRGTATKARSLGRRDLAGKTGTTNDQRDAWFNGFNHSIVAIAWVGFDSTAPLGRGEVGGRAALPAWITFMEEALKGVEEQPLKMPEGMVTIRIDPTTGKPARADQNNAIFEVFRTELAPQDGSPDTPGLPGESENPIPDAEEGGGELF